MGDCLIVEEKLSLVDCHIMLDQLKKMKGPVGEGQSGKVYILPDLNYAIKVIPKRENDYQSYDSSGESSSDFSDADSSSENEDDYEDDETGTSEEEFFSEIDALNNINCPNTIKYYGYYEDDDNYYLVTQSIEGPHLGNIDKNTYEKIEIIECVKQLISGLTCIHNSGFAHNDIKLDNIMYDNKNSFYFIDFGLTCSECAGILPGNDFYLAPEFSTVVNYKDEITVFKLQQNDLWALGLVIIQLALWEQMKEVNDQLEFGRRARGNPSKIEGIIKETIPTLIEKVYNKTNNVYIKNLLTSLMNTNPNERKLV